MRRSMVGLLAAVGTALSTLGALALGSGVLVIFAVVAAAAAGLAAYLSLSPVAASTPAEPLDTYAAKPYKKNLFMLTIVVYRTIPVVNIG